MSPEPNPRLGYLFAPPPDWVVDDWAEGRLSDRGLLLIVFLYRRADKRMLAERRPTPRLSRETIADVLSWTKDLESLSRWLRRFRDAARYFTYVTPRDATGGYRYVFTLLPDVPSVSDPCPTSEASSRPGSETTETGSDSGTEATQAERVSDLATVGDSPPCPTSEPLCPTSEAPEDRSVERKPNGADEEHVRPLDVQDNTNPSVTERFEEKRLDQDHVDGSTNDDRLIEALAETNEEREADSMADFVVRARAAQLRRDLSALPDDEREFIAALMDEFDATFVEDRPPLCGYPAHREREMDWLNDGGRPVCGVCHPRASREVEA